MPPMLPLWLAWTCACVRAPDADSPGSGPQPPELPYPTSGPVPCCPPTPGGGDDDDDDDGVDCIPTAALSINEVSATNRERVLDDYGEAPDWLELYNADTVPIDLAGWALSDDPDEPDGWTLPALVLDPGAFLLVYASGRDKATVAETWDTRVDQGDDWRYLAVTAPPDPDWFLPAFDDRGWDTGPSGFGRGDDDDATSVAADTVYARIGFELTADEVADLTGLYLHLDYDDAFVAYLNGVEVARANIGIPGVPPAWDQPADDVHEAALPQDLPLLQLDLTGSLPLLVEGGNLLAVEVHNAVDSSDLSLVPFLSVGFGTERPARASSVLAPIGAVLHTDFSLAAEGEEVRLIDPAGCEADAIEPDRMYTDQSYGRQPDGGVAEGYFLEPTPGGPNVTESRPGFAAEPVFVPDPGHYPDGTDVSVVGSPQSVIRVAWAGAEPTEDDPPYSGPLVTGTDGEAVVLRARAWEDGLWPSPIATATYLLREPGTLPIVSVVTDPPNLWDEQTGIYVFGTDYDPEPPYYGANFHQDWERPAHAACWEPDGSAAFAVDAGLEIYGGTTRAYAQKSFLLKLRSGYGDETIEYDLFPGLGVSSFERLVLRAAGNDWHGCGPTECEHGAHLRDGLMQRLAGQAGIDVLAYRPAELYLNGEYWGIYDLREQAEETYIAAHHGFEDIDLLTGNAKVIVGDAFHYLQTLDWLRTHDLADPVNYAHVQTLIDVDELAAYLAFEVFYANTDWPGNNIKYWRPRTEDGRWRWLMYDTDFGMGRWGRSPSHPSLAQALAPDGVSWPNPAWSTELFRLLLQSPDFEQMFVNRYADYMNTLLTPEATRAALQEVADGIAAEMPRQHARWGAWDDGAVHHALEPEAWDDEVAWIDEWLGERPAHARAHVVEQFGLAGTWTLTLDADPPGAGTFALTAVEVEGPFTGEYFLGMPVTVTAQPALGYTFVGWSDPDLPADPTVTLDPEGPRSLVAHFR